MKSKTEIINGWDFFNELFSNGEKVVVITDTDKIYAGTATITKIGISLARVNNKRIFFYWDQVEFISHDGFPVKKLFGADGSDSIEKLDAADLCEDMIDDMAPHIHKKYTVVKGDPYLIENCGARIIKAHYPESGIETGLQLISGDGAVGLMYNFESIYHFERTA